MYEGVVQAGGRGSSTSAASTGPVGTSTGPKYSTDDVISAVDGSVLGYIKIYESAWSSWKIGSRAEANVAVEPHVRGLREVNCARHAVE